MDAEVGEPLQSTSPRPVVRRLIQVYIFTFLIMACLLLSNDYTRSGVPEIALTERLRMCGITAAGPLSMLFLPGFSGLEAAFVLVILGATLGFAVRSPDVALARWVGYLGVVFWLILGNGIALIGI